MLTKVLKMSPGTTIFQVLTSSDTAYVVAVLKNGKEMWDNEEEGNKESKKARPLFTGGRVQSDRTGSLFGIRKDSNTTTIPRRI